MVGSEDNFYLELCELFTSLTPSDENYNSCSFKKSIKVASSVAVVLLKVSRKNRKEVS